MTLNQFITTYNIRPADSIVMKKKLFGMVDHYVIYLGLSNDRKHIFVANYTKGVMVIPDHELREFLQILQPTKIDRFHGTESQRVAAVKRAVSRIGEKAYNYVTNNCEHFKNWVHKGEHKSTQVDNVMEGVAIGAGVAALAGLVSLIFSKD